MATRSAVVNILGIGHLVVGAGALLAPFTTAKAFFIDQSESTLFISRLFGSRDLVLGAAIQFYTTPGTEANRLAILACAAIHTIDVASGIITYAQSHMSFETLLIAIVVDGSLPLLSWWELSSW